MNIFQVGMRDRAGTKGQGQSFAHIPVAGCVCAVCTVCALGNREQELTRLDFEEESRKYKKFL